ncbi:MAG: hypothetical protein RL150_744 [Candidatus Parcubacteria bacterium]|jgi:competence protein ComEC
MQYRQTILFLAAAGLALGLWWAGKEIFAVSAAPVLRVDILDVGQGDALLVTAPNATSLLIDTGANQAVLHALGEVLPLSVQSLHGILLTHPDLDHIGGAVDVLTSYDVPTLFVASTTKANDVTAAIDATAVPQQVLARGDRLLLDATNNVYADVLAPDASWNPADTNDSSLVLKLVFGETCFILTGDASIVVERVLAYTDRENLDCDVLKVGHHGSDTSTSDVFVGYVSPQYAAISAGKDNDFGHPHQSVLDTLTRFGVATHRTDLEGTISFFSDGKTVTVD